MTARLYRKALWADADTYIEVRLEKDALAGVIYPITALYDVPLMVARGYSSETFRFEAIESRKDDDRQYIVYYLGDFDRSGRDATATLKEKLERFVAENDVQVAFIQLAIAADHILRFDESDKQVLVDLGGLARISHNV
jgi:hypothetical protein